MTSTASGSGYAISLPKGGGALHGLGEKFSPDLHTGTGNFTVPIVLPPGRNGFQPELSLVYSTGAGNGPFGLGWSLSIPGVARKTSKGIPVYDDSRDTFVLSGAEDLVPVPGAPAGATRYRPRTEGLFARIDHHGGRGRPTDHWEVWSKNGLISQYGTQDAAGDDSAVIAKPSDRSRVFSWKLTRTTDPFGNRIEYAYERDRQRRGPHDWDQLYLSRISYADYGDPADPRYLVTVTFYYDHADRRLEPDFNETTRPDPFSEYRAGFEIRTARRCTSIVVSTHHGAAAPVRTYHLSYLDERTPVPPLPLNGVSLLSQIQVEGHAGADSERLPPLDFGYTDFRPDREERRNFFPLRGSELPGGSLADPAFELVDLFGNGLPDIVEMDGATRYWRNIGEGRFANPREMTSAPAGFRLADPGVQLLDANGDGRTDLLVTTEAAAGYFSLSSTGSWDDRSFTPYQIAPTFTFEDPEVRLVDLDGDGISDVIRSGSRLECFFNSADRRDAWRQTRWVERQPLEAFPDVSFSDPRVKWADMTGDGLQDIVLVYDGNVEYWPNLGRGSWGARIHMRDSPTFPYGYDPGRILIGDVDGDGAADIVYVDDARVTLWINQSGNGWSAPVEIPGTAPVSDVDAVRLTDMLGTGVNGILWSADAGSRSAERMLFLDLTGGVKPYLLSEMNNQMGALTKITYLPSTRFYLDDEAHHHSRWTTPLPFPVQVVARVEAWDSFSAGKLTTEYRYHHGYWDGTEREFRGFGQVERFDGEDFGDGAVHFSPALLTRTWFHQGPVGESGDWVERDLSSEFWPVDPAALRHQDGVGAFLVTLPSRSARRDALRSLRGRVLRTELYALDDAPQANRPYTVTETRYGIAEVDQPPAGSIRSRIFFPHVLAERTTQWERGNDPLTQVTFVGAYDDYGQPGSQISIAVPRGRDFRATAPAGGPASAPYLATRTLTSYAMRDDAQRYIVDRTCRVTRYEVSPTSAIYAASAPSVFELAEAIAEGSALVELRIIGQTLNFYDRDSSRPDAGAFLGLPFREVGDYGALVRSESLALTPEILHQTYRSGNSTTAPVEEPPYLAPNGAGAWTLEYPSEFRAGPALAGYAFRAGGNWERGYFVASTRRRYDFHDDPNGARGLVAAMRDPFGGETTATYDAPYRLLPVGVTEPRGLETSAAYDYTVLQPREVTDPNGNRTSFAFTPLGLLRQVWAQGKASRNEGDRLRPSVSMEYDFSAFAVAGGPVSVRTIRQIHHDTEPEPAATIETVEYTDGLGRLLQTRTRAEDLIFADESAADADRVFGTSVLPREQPGAGGTVVGRAAAMPGARPRVVVSGWQVYDNKGRVVEKFEPFFAEGWEYAEPTAAELGRKATMFYDPRGRVTRAVNPDGSERSVVHGVPGTIALPDLVNPSVFEPTPWEAYTYDADDNAGRTHPAATADYRHHWNTPSSVVIDALGRTALAVERNRDLPASAAAALAGIEEHRSVSVYDIDGNLLTVADPLGRVAFRYVYDLMQHPLRVESIDGGVRRSVLDASGRLIEQRDSKGAISLCAYDARHRPIRVWARDDGAAAVTLRERLVYGGDPGSGLTAAQIGAGNLLGKLYQHYDEAGLATFASYDFKGNVLEKSRRVIKDGEILGVFGPAAANSWRVDAYRTDWQPPGATQFSVYAASRLEAASYDTSTTYDALNRIKTLQYPEDVGDTARLPSRQLCRLGYNRAGALESVELDGETYVQQIVYNAKGQRTLIAYGNGIMTRHAYDEQTSRMVRLRSERFTAPGANAFRPGGAVLQDVAYAYDLTGNVRVIRDRTPDCGIPNTALGLDALDRTFDYDALSRLAVASGRECMAPPLLEPWDDGPRCQDATLTRAYIERYTHDAAGNLTLLRHDSGPGATFNRAFALAAGSNQLATVTSGATTRPYAYDSSGNLLRESLGRHLEWDQADRLKAYRSQTPAPGTSPADDAWSEPTLHAHYLYDAGGQRVVKLIRKQGGEYEVTVYIDGIFEHRRWGQSTSRAGQNSRLHVMDNQSRIAIRRVGDSDDARPEVQFHLADHLGSASVVTGGPASSSANAPVSREEYYPYGESSFGGFGRKRYRFTGKERDEESGLYYHGARYYAPWLARWASCDPVLTNGKGGSLSRYQYVSNNPLRYTDAAGLSDGEPLPDNLPPRDDTPVPQEPGPSFPAWMSEDAKKKFRDDKQFLGVSRLTQGRDPLTADKAPDWRTRDQYTAYEKRVFFIGEVARFALITALTTPAFLEWGLMRTVAGGSEAMEVAAVPRIVRAAGTDATVVEGAEAMRKATNFPLRQVERGALAFADDATVVAHGVVPSLEQEALGAVKIQLGPPYGQVSAKEFANILVKDLEWGGGTLRLGTCRGGVCAPGGEIFGEQLSRELSQLGSPSTVISPKGNVNYQYSLPQVRPPNVKDPLPLGQGWDYF